METITKCLNEWNATVEALGQGKQVILIRKYNTTLEKFLLYPTTSYAMKEDFLKSFKKEYKSFAEENALPKKEGDKSEVKYLAVVEKVLEKPSTRMGMFNKYHIWTNEHVKSFIGKSKAYVWILRVYQLENPELLSRTRGMRYANVEENVTIEDVEPVLSDYEFSSIVQEIEMKR